MVFTLENLSRKTRNLKNKNAHSSYGLRLALSSVDVQ